MLLKTTSLSFTLGFLAFYLSTLAITPVFGQSNPYAYSGSGSYRYRGTGNLRLSGNSTNFNFIFSTRGSVTLEGRLPGSLVNGKQLSPGLGVLPAERQSSLFVQRNFTQFRQGILDLEISSDTKFDRIAVGQKAQLDGTLRLRTLPGFDPATDKSLTILTAQDGVVGTFSSVDQQFSMVAFDVVYQEKAVILQLGGTRIVSLLSTFEQEGFQFTPNQRAVAIMVDQYSRVSSDNEVVAFLLSAGVETLPLNLDRIAPEEMAALFQVTQAGAGLFFETIVQHDSHSEIPAPSAIVGASEAGENGKAQEPKAEGKATVEPTHEKRWAAWTSLSGDFAEVDGDANAAGFDFGAGGLADWFELPN